MTDENKNNELWRMLLTGEADVLVKYRRLFKVIPADNRCRACLSPFNGVGGQVSRVIFRRVPSRVNPHFCSACYTTMQENPGGAEVNMTLVFADIRGSTTLAEDMGTLAFSSLISRFYVAATHVFSESNAWIERLIGDQVIGLYLQSMAGPDHAAVAVRGAGELLRAVGYGSPDGAWLPLGIGVHTGTTFMGSVGSDTGLRDITVLGDAPNVAARLSSMAAAGEILISDAASARAGLDVSALEARTLNLKGRAEPIDVHVTRVDSPERSTA